MIRSVSTRRAAQVAAVDGVAATYGLGVALLGAHVPGESEVAAAAVIGYQGNVAGVPDPPPPGRAYADERLRASGVNVDDVVRLGPDGVPIRVVGFVEDTNFLLQGALWVDPGTWRRTLNASRPGAALRPGDVQTIWVDVERGADPDVVATRIDTATGTTDTFTDDEAVLALPGIKEQRATFNQILGVTFFVAGLVVALFFALLTLERVPLFGVLKAIGASSTQLIAGLMTRPPRSPSRGLDRRHGGAHARRSHPTRRATPTDRIRAVFVAISIIVTALVGSAISLRRIIKVDPAASIGAGI